MYWLILVFFAWGYLVNSKAKCVRRGSRIRFVLLSMTELVIVWLSVAVLLFLR